MTPSHSESDSKLRLLQVVLDLDPGGTQRLVIEMSKCLRSVAEVRICCLDEAGGWAAELTGAGIPVVALDRKPGFRWRTALDLAEQIREHQADVLHCHHYSPFVYGQLAARLRPGTRLVYTEHGRLSDSPTSLKRRLANAFLSRLPGRFFAVSRNLRDHLVASTFPARRIGVIHNGIDPGERPTSDARDRARLALDLPAGAFVFGTVARLDPVKDLPTLIDAFAGLHFPHPETVLVLVGDGAERDRLERHAARAAPGERIRFVGTRHDVRRILPAFDVFVNSSITEGISVTILEAMAASLPVVATAVGGTPEVVTDGETGLLVAAHESAGLAAAMTALATDAERRKALGRAGRRRVQAAFGMDRMVHQYLRVYGRAEEPEQCVES